MRFAGGWWGPNLRQIRTCRADTLGGVTLPRSVRFALWLSAWLDGSASTDDARDGILAEDVAHDVSGLPGTSGAESLVLAFGPLRTLARSGAALALPVPGDPLGLAGPPDLNVAAIDVGEAVILPGADVALLPHAVGAGVSWVAHPAQGPRQVPDLPEADRNLREAVLRAAERLADLDVARARPDLADELQSLRDPLDLRVPASLDGRVLRALTLATRCCRIVTLARADDGAALTATEAEARRSALVPLDHAARRAMVAACEPRSGR